MKKAVILLLAFALLLPAWACADGQDYGFDEKKGVVKSYSGPGGDVEVPGQIGGADVYVMGDQAFVRRKDITSLTFSEPLLALEDGAVASMPALTQVTLPDTLEYIASSNFMDCEALERVVIPPRVLSIGPDCFKWAHALVSVTFTGRAPEIGTGCFTGISDELVCYVPDDEIDAYRRALPEGVRVEGSGRAAVAADPVSNEADFDFDPPSGTVTAYRGKDTRVAIPAAIGGTAVRAIGSRAFRENRRLFWVSVPDGVETIGEEAFRSAEYLVRIDLPDSVREIGDRAFYFGYIGGSFPWPASLERIGIDAFGSTQIAGEVTLPESLVEIGGKAFEWSRVQRVVLPQGIREIGPQAFKSSKLQSVSFGNVMPVLAPDAFSGAYLKRVEVPGNIADADMEAYAAYFAAEYPDCLIVRGDRTAPEGSAAPEPDTDGGEDAAIARYCGTWYLSRIEMYGYETMPAEMGFEITLELNEDGTGEWIMTDAGWAVGESVDMYSFVWEVDGDTLTLTQMGEVALVLTDVGGTLEARTADRTMFYTREAPSAAYVPGETARQAGPEAFEGIWTCVRVGDAAGVASVPAGMFREALRAADLQLPATVAIAGDRVRLGDGGVRKFLFEDGVMRPEDGTDCEIAILTDGMLVYRDGASDTALYCEKTGESADLPKEFPPTGVPCICAGALVNGRVVDHSVLAGEYSLCLGSDGTASLVLAGTRLEVTGWHMEEGCAVIDYPGGEMRLTEYEGGMALQWTEAMTIVFRPE